MVRRLRISETKIPFITALANSFIYPTAPKDRMKLAGFAFFLGFYAFMKLIMPLNPIIWANWAVGAFLFGVFLSYVIRATNSVGHGKLALPDWPDFTYYMDDLIIPSIRVVLVLFVWTILPVILAFALIATQVGFGIFDIVTGMKSQTAMNTEFKKQMEEEQKKMLEMQKQIFNNPDIAKNHKAMEELRKEYEPTEDSYKSSDPKSEVFNAIQNSLGFGKAKKRIPLLILTVFVFGIITLFGAIVSPMAFYIAAGFESAKAALNPFTLIKLISKVPGPYFLLIASLILITAAQIFVYIFFTLIGLMKVPFISHFIKMAVDFYFLLVSAYLIGLFAYQNRYELGFDYENSELADLKPDTSRISAGEGLDGEAFQREAKVDLKPIPAVEIDKSSKKGTIPVNPHLQKPRALAPFIEINTPLDEDVKKGREFKKLGELDTALEHFQLALEVDPTHPIALRECFKIYLIKEDKPKAENAINRLMNHYTSKNKKNQALILFGEVTGVLPMHTFSQQSQKKISLWLKEIEDYKNALIAFRNYAYRYTKDPYSATCLMEAAIICRDHLSLKELAIKILNMIKKNYPKSKEAPEAVEILEQIHLS